MTEAQIFECVSCGQQFTSVTSPEEAEEEFHLLFPGEELEEAGKVCHDCYKKIMGSLGYNIRVQ